MNDNNNDKLLSIKEAASLLGISAETLRRWDRSGKLSAVKIKMGKREDRRYRLKDLKNLLANTPQKKGKLLEEILEELINELLKEWHYQKEFVRTQTSGSQFGKDNVSRWIKPKTHTEDELVFEWSFEAKNYGTITAKDVISRTEIRSKVFDILDSTIPLDVWCIFSPFGTVDNTFFQTIHSKRAAQRLPFKIALWTRDHDIESLISCFPTIYKKLYGKESQLDPNERKAILQAWKNKVEKATIDGQILRKGVFPQRQKVQVENVEEITKNVVEGIRSEIKRSITDTTSSKDVSTSYSQIEKNETDEEIDLALSYLKKGEIEQAKERFFLILGKVQGRADLNHQLARVYNNIGVAFNVEKKTDDAIEYFKKAIATENDFIKAQTNLASGYLLKVEEIRDLIEKEQDQTEKKNLEEQLNKNLEKAKAIIVPLWENFEKTNDPIVLQKYMHLLRVELGIGKVAEFIEKQVKKDQGRKIFNSNGTLAFIAGETYLASYKPDEALHYANLACKLDPDVETLVLRGRVRIALALKDDTDRAHEDYKEITPPFTKKGNLKKAQADFDAALEVAIKKEQKFWYSELGYFLRLTSIWLGDTDYRGNQPSNLESDKSALGQEFLKVIQLFRSGDIELSYPALKALPQFDSLPYEEIFRYARVYLNNGFPEIALDLFKRIEDQSIARGDYFYWFDMSLIYVLLGYKNQAIMAASRAKELAKGNGRRLAFSHFGAVLSRYADEEGGDRLLENAFEFKNEFPELDIIKSFDYNKEKEKIIKTINDRAEWVKNIKEIFRSQPIPSYYLEKIFKKPYIDVWRGRDPELNIDYTVNNEEVMAELENNFTKGKVFVFDYVSLLTMSKLNLLNDLEAFFPEMQISFSLFQKIQEELAQVEDPTLRRLWEFLRKTKAIKKVKRIPNRHLVNDRSEDIFDSWLIEEIKLAKSSKAVMVTDDFRMLRYLKSESVYSVNTWLILQKAQKNGILDSRMYSRALGELASCFYLFISFNGDDLYLIAADDNFKLKPRTYHLINQIFLPGTYYKSFSEVFVKFIWNLWKAGAISEDKVFWLGYLSDILGELVEKNLMASPEEKQAVFATSSDFGAMWSIAIKEGNEEDIAALEAAFPNMLLRPIFSKAKLRLQERLRTRTQEKK